MMENWELLLMPLVGGIIGWITNMIAIKMLFYQKHQSSSLSYHGNLPVYYRNDIWN